MTNPADATWIQLLILAVTTLWGLVLLMFGFLLKSIKADIHGVKDEVDICVMDTKDCNASIASLATKVAVTDSRVIEMTKSIDTIFVQTDKLQTSIVALQTRAEIARGHD